VNLPLIKEACSISKSQQDNRAIQRYLIKRVDESSYTTDRGYQMPEKVSHGLKRRLATHPDTV